MIGLQLILGQAEPGIGLVLKFDYRVKFIYYAQSSRIPHPTC